jgi:hypothetical protein
LIIALAGLLSRPQESLLCSHDWLRSSFSRAAHLLSASSPCDVSNEMALILLRCETSSRSLLPLRHTTGPYSVGLRTAACRSHSRSDILSVLYHRRPAKSIPRTAFSVLEPHVLRMPRILVSFLGDPRCRFRVIRRVSPSRVTVLGRRGLSGPPHGQPAAGGLGLVSRRLLGDNGPA